MHPFTISWLLTLLRLLKGMIKATESWLVWKQKSSTSDQKPTQE